MTKKYTYHHTSLARGYVSVKSEGIREAYNRKFGTGYTVKRNNPGSTRYCFVDYYINQN